MRILSSLLARWGNNRYAPFIILSVNSSATKELLSRAVAFLKDNDTQAYFQALSDAVEVNGGYDEEEDPDRFAIEFETLDSRLRKNA